MFCSELCKNLYNHKYKYGYKYQKEYRGRSPENFIKTLLGHFKRRLTLTNEDVIGIYYQQNGKCALTGREMTHTSGRGRVKTNISIDRIDSSKGYTPDNIQLVCFIVNIIKNSFSKEELVDWCSAILEQNKKD